MVLMPAVSLRCEWRSQPHFTRLLTYVNRLGQDAEILKWSTLVLTKPLPAAIIAPNESCRYKHTVASTSGRNHHRRVRERAARGRAFDLHGRRGAVRDRVALAARIGHCAADQHGDRDPSGRGAGVGALPGTTPGGDAALHWHGLSAGGGGAVRLSAAVAQRAAGEPELAVYPVTLHPRRHDRGADDHCGAAGGGLHHGLRAGG